MCERYFPTTTATTTNQQITATSMANPVEMTNNNNQNDKRTITKDHATVITTDNVSKIIATTRCRIQWR